MESYKVMVWERGQQPSQAVGNALRFGNEEEARQYGDDLQARWSLVEGLEVQQSIDEVNYRFVDGKLEKIKPADALTCSECGEPTISRVIPEGSNGPMCDDCREGNWMGVDER